MKIIDAPHEHPGHDWGPGIRFDQYMHTKRTCEICGAVMHFSRNRWSGQYTLTYNPPLARESCAGEVPSFHCSNTKECPTVGKCTCVCKMCKKREEFVAAMLDDLPEIDDA